MVLQFEVDLDDLVVGRVAVDGDADIFARQRERDVGGEIGRIRHVDTAVGNAIAELLRADEIEIAPGRRFGLIAELLEGVGLQIAGVLIARIGVDDVLEELRDPAVFALVVGFLRLLDDGLRAPHQLDVARRRFGRRQRIEVGRIAAEIAEIEIVDRAGVVADRAVIAARRPVLGERFRQLHHVADLRQRIAAVGEMQRAVVDILESVAVVLDVRDDLLVARDRPVMRRVEDFRLVAPHVERLIEIFDPFGDVAGLGAAQRVEIVQGVNGVLRGAEPSLGGIEEVHLARRLAARRQQKLEHHAIDLLSLAGICHPVVVALRREQGRRLGAAEDAEPRAERLRGAGADRLHHGAERGRNPEAGAIHIGRAPEHGVAGIQIFADRLVGEALRRDDPNVAVLNGFRGRHAADAAVMIDVAVSEDHRLHTPLSILVHVLPIKLERGGGRDRRGGAVDDDETVIVLAAFHDRQAGDVDVAHLVEAVGDLEQAGAAIELADPPQARVHGVRRRLFGRNRERLGVEKDLAVVHDFVARQRGDEALVRVLKVGAIVVRQSEIFRVLRLGIGGRRLGLIAAAGGCGPGGARGNEIKRNGAECSA